MAAISKDGKQVLKTSLSQEEYKEYRKLYDQAAEMVINLIKDIWHVYNLLLEFEDYNLIGSFFPRESNYKTWSAEEFQYQLDILEDYYEERGANDKEYLEAGFDTWNTKNNQINNFPYYQEFVYALNNSM